MAFIYRSVRPLARATHHEPIASSSTSHLTHLRRSAINFPSTQPLVPSPRHLYSAVTHRSIVSESRRSNSSTSANPTPQPAASTQTQATTPPSPKTSSASAPDPAPAPAAAPAGPSHPQLIAPATHCPAHPASLSRLTTCVPRTETHCAHRAGRRARISMGRM